MQTVIEISRLKPIGTTILVKRLPVAQEIRKILIPEAHRDRNNLQGQLYCGTVIAVGERTRSAKFGRTRGWFEPGDRVWFFNLWDWQDREVVLQDSVSGDEYLTVNEDDVKAYEIMGGGG